MMTAKEQKDFDALTERVRVAEVEIGFLKERNKIMDKRILETLDNITKSRNVAG